MSDMILNADILPEPLLRLVSTEKICVRQEDGIVKLIPLEKGEPENIIKKLRGSCADGKLSVSKFMAQKQADRDLEL